MSKFKVSINRIHVKLAGLKSERVKSCGTTGWSILFCLILAGSYDKNGISTGKKLVGMCSLYRDISPETVYLEI